jgi:hypothetical protein
MTDIAAWPAEAKAAILAAESDEELVDLAGDLASVVSQLGALKREVASEVHSDTSGTRWRYFIPGMKAKRTYNDSSLLNKLAKYLDMSLLNSILWAKNEGIIKIEWQYSKLDRWAKQNNIELIRTTAREVHDGDEYDIGEIWSPQYGKYEAVTDE